MNWLLFEQGQSGLSTIGFKADEAESFAHSDAQLANALLVVDDQQTDAKVFLVELGAHRAFPIVFSTAEIRSCTRNGFSR